jgi:hypothetical protein
MTPALETFRDWVPIRFYRREAAPFVDWCYMGDARFTHPFFADTIRRRMSQPFNLLFRHQTPIEFLGELCEFDSVIPPTGFIFHMSRCGSTLVAQMLAALPENVVISEAPPIDSAVGAKGSDSEDGMRAEWLRWMVGAFARKRNFAEQNFFIKFDSWNVLDLEFITDVFPDVPWIFLYRNPVEVIVSQMRQRGSQMVPGAMDTLLPGVSFTEEVQMPAEEYCARVLARFCSSALKYAGSKKALLVNYDQLPGAVAGGIGTHFGVTFTRDEIDRMNSASKFDAKTPQIFFESDTERKRTGASGAAREAAARWVDPLYEQLEIIRSSFTK